MRIIIKKQHIMKKQSIDFRFSKNWSSFMKWSDAAKAATKMFFPWEIQQKKIEDLFEATVPAVVDWKKLWKDYKSWYVESSQSKGGALYVKWSEQQRQMETLMLNQVKDLDKEIFVLVYLNKGVPEMDTQKMSYWEALHTKANLEGDANGKGGDENIEKIIIINLNKLIQ